MAYSRNYSRIFITLKQERPDFCLNSRPAMGRCIIEIRNGKGKLMTFIQGLKPDILYKIHMISCGTEKSIGVSVGFIDIDNNGKGEMKWEFDPDNVGNSGINIENFNVIAFLVPGNNDITAPIVGYSDNVVLWKNNFKIFDKEEINENKELEDNDNIPETDKLNSKENQLNESSLQENLLDEENKITQDDSDKDLKNNEKTDIKDENQKPEPEPDTNLNENKPETKCDEKSSTDNSNNIEKTNIKEENIASKKGIFEEDNINNYSKFKNIVEKFKQEMGELKYYTSMTEETEKEISNEIETDIDDISYLFKNNPEMKPFVKNNNNAKWIRISVNDLSVLPGNAWKYINNPFVNYSYKKYRHLLLGMYTDSNNRYLILGIPGMYKLDYKMEAGIQGFRTFKTCENKKAEENDYGYWIMNLED